MYIDPEDLLTYYDATKVLSLLSDDTAIPATAADLTNPASTPYAIAATAIRSASGDIDSHCQIGLRYTRADLESIAADVSTETALKRSAPLKRLTADLAFGFLMARRGYTAEAMRALAPQYEAALMTLDRLANGIQIFDIDANLQASVPKIVGIGVNDEGSLTRANRLFGLWAGTQFWNRQGGW